MINIKWRYGYCPICGKTLERTEKEEHWVCNCCDLVFFIKIVGKPNRDNEVNRIGG